MYHTGIFPRILILFLRQPLFEKKVELPNHLLTEEHLSYIRVALYNFLLAVPLEWGNSCGQCPILR